MLAVADRLFAVPRPQHFTDYRHCCECAEHDRTLQAFDPRTIGLEQLGNAAWDPLCFAGNEAFKYYFPASLRLALTGSGEDYYIDQFLFHLIADGPRNRRWAAFSKRQRSFVVAVLEWLLEQRCGEIERNRDGEHLLQAHQIWSDNG